LSAAARKRGDAPEGAGAVAADPDRRPRLLHGLGREADIAEAEELALERWVGVRPQRREDLEDLVGLAAAPVERHTQDLQLLLPPAHAHAADQPAIGERVDGGEHLGHHHRVAVPEDEHRGAQPRARRTDGGGGQGHDRLQIRLVRRMRKAPARVAAGCRSRKDDVIAHPQRGDAAPVRLARERRQRLAGGERPLGGKVAPDVHRPS
jgi:hypothetical protein